MMVVVIILKNETLRPKRKVSEKGMCQECRKDIL